MLPIFLLLHLLISLCLASQGDMSLAFTQCINEECYGKFDCPPRFSDYGWVRGDCCRCKQKCIWHTVDLFKEEYNIVPQFHGKWPFLPFDFHFVGFHVVVQEPASFFFSLGNFWTVLVMRERIAAAKHLPNKMTWMYYTSVGLVTWLCSAFFHAWDFWLSELLDYFSAFGYVLFAFYVSVQITNDAIHHKPIFSRLLAVTLSLFYIYHISCMWTHFDYGYNMKCCIGFAVITTVLYVAYLLKRWKSGLSSHSDRLLFFLLLWMNLSICAELFDFSPILWTFDAHSIFHLLTIPVPLLFVRFLAAHTVDNYSKLDDAMKLL